MPNTRLIFITILAALMFLLLKAATAETISKDTFGLHVHGLGKGNPWPSVPFGFIRLWDSNTTWRELEPEKGIWNFEILDKYVQSAEINGVKVLLTLGQTPSWAAADRQTISPYAPGASSPPRSLDDWRDYVKTLAKRYKGRIRHWEVWNEVNVEHFWTGDFVTLVRMEQIASRALKSIDPSNVLLTPSIQGGAFGKLDKYFKAGGGQFADVVSYHFYAPKDEPEVLGKRIERVRAIMRSNGLAAKPLWNTEMGWLIANRNGGFGQQLRPEWSSWRQVGYNEAAGIVMRSYLINLAYGVNHVFWYAWNNGAMGLAEDEGKHPKPAATGYTRLVEWLRGVNIIKCNEIQNIWFCELQRAGNTRYIVWSKKYRSFKLPADWQADSITRIDSSSYSLNASEFITIGPEPVLLRQNTNGA